MFYVQCPYCGALVEIPSDAVGRHRSDPWNVAKCSDCDASFDYHNEEVQFEPDAHGVL
jgi:hypothetical protein